MAIFQRPHEPLRKIELFAGVGGGILGGILLGHKTVCAVEREPYAAAVLLARQNDGTFNPFPVWDDVCTFDGRPWRGFVDIVSGGFPCQDISTAGSGAGLEGERSGLWQEMARIIGEVRPRFAFVENSPMLTSRGLGRVLGDLAEMGYDCRWGVISATDTGAPHKRDRIWILATNTCRIRWDNGGDIWQERPIYKELCRDATQNQWKGDRGERRSSSPSSDLDHTFSERCNTRWNDYSKYVWQFIGSTGQYFDSVSDSLRFGSQGSGNSCGHSGSVGLCSRTWGNEKQGLPDTSGGGCKGSRQFIESMCTASNRDRQTSKPFNVCIYRKWPVEPDLGRVANGVAFRVHRITAIGNGQVPRVYAAAWYLLGGV